jgi:hypothetical protein
MKHAMSRRDWLRVTAAGAFGASASGWMERLAAAATADQPKRKRSCILLWMNGGPSTIDLFDLKPEHKNGGPLKPIKTNAAGLEIGETLPTLAKHGDKIAVIRSLSTKEADHGRATYLMRTGRAPGAGGPIQYPTLGSLVSKELEAPDAELPAFVAVAPVRNFNQAAYSPGFLGPRYAPLVVADGVFTIVPQPNRNPNQPQFAQPPQQGGNGYEQALKVQDLDLPGGVVDERNASRVRLLNDMESDFLASRDSRSAESHHTAYKRAVTLMQSRAVKAFDLAGEPEKLRDAYGRNLFGQGCLLARRLVEAGVNFVEVSFAGIPGWDTHQDNFNQVKNLSAVLDPAWGTLMGDLADRGLLETTTIVWMGEFGRTPKINGNSGRDHWAVSWSGVIGGGGVKGGQAYGATSVDGMEVKDGLCNVADFLGTVGSAVGLDITKQNDSNVNRPIRFVDPGAKPIKEVLA